MEYNKTLNRFVVGPEQELLIALRASIERLRKVDSDAASQRILAYGSVNDGDRIVTVKNADLLPVVLAFDTAEQVVRMLVAASRMLSGAGIPPVDKSLPTQLSDFPMTPLPSEQEIEDWIAASTDYH